MNKSKDPSKALPNLDYGEIDEILTQISKKTPKVAAVLPAGVVVVKTKPEPAAVQPDSQAQPEEKPKPEVPEVTGTVEEPSHGKKTTIKLEVTFANGIEFKLANKVKIKLEKLIQKALKDNPDFEYAVSIDETFARTPKKGGSFVNFAKL